MKSRKKRNNIPYLILLIIHTSLLIYTFYKKKDRRNLFVLLISNIGLAYFFEYIIVILFNGYTYKPNVFKNEYLDNVFGGILSQAIFVPFTTLFITAFNLGWKFKFAISVYFSIVEFLFVGMRIYTHHWWRTRYTLFLLPIYFHISDKWYQHLKQANPSVLFFSLNHLIGGTESSLLFIQALRGKIKFRFGFGRFHSWHKHFILVSIYSIIQALFTAWQIRENKGFPIIRILSFRLLSDFILTKMKWLKLDNNKVLNNLPYHLLMTFLSRYFKNILYK
jgi:hypothetical protein